jgi:hypothetical protein
MTCCPPQENCYVTQMNLTVDALKNSNHSDLWSIQGLMVITVYYGVETEQTISTY